MKHGLQPSAFRLRGAAGRLLLAGATCAVLVPVLAQQSDKDAAPKWDVAAALGPTRPIAFETSEGTWVNVDVSPDGKTVVFDLLGDLYSMPVVGTGGGLAVRLTSGPAFDMQPRFSPDGASIAFASDRDGLTNIWIAKADGSAPGGSSFTRSPMPSARKTMSSFAASAVCAMWR